MTRIAVDSCRDPSESARTANLVAQYAVPAIVTITLNMLKLIRLRNKGLKPGCRRFAAIAPMVAKNVSDYQNTGKIDPNGVSQIVVVLATTGLTILGRVDASTPDLYT